MIRRIEGDVQVGFSRFFLLPVSFSFNQRLISNFLPHALQQALAEDLIKTFPKVPIMIKPQNNQVVLKSEMVLELKAFLTARGF